jgi:outer membrane immunogenic protein
MEEDNRPAGYGYEYGSFYGNMDITHFTGGGGAKIGYNWRMGRIVVGADLDWSIMGGTAQGCAHMGFHCYQSRLDNYGSLRVKAGIAIDDGFFYATGGIAFANREYAYGQHSRSVGLALGADFEYALSDSISIDASICSSTPGRKAW